MVQQGESRNILEFDIEEIYKLVTTACYKYNPNFMGEFEDMVQDVMMYVVDRLPYYNADKGKLSTFVYRNTQNALINYNVKMNANKRKWFFHLQSLDRVVGQDPENDLLSNVAHEDTYIDNMLFKEIYDNTSGLDRVFMDQLINRNSDRSIYKPMGKRKHKLVQMKRDFFNRIKEQYFVPM